jgi:hypothetical protein
MLGIANISKFKVNARALSVIASGMWGVLSICFLVGGWNHLSDLLRDGLFPYVMVPLPINVFWTSLSVIDVAVAGLLWRHSKLGLMIALLVMVLDVVINTYVFTCLTLPFGFVPLQLQTLFLGFLLGCSGFLWFINRQRAPLHVE